MKNSKLLLTSALVGTVAMGAVANAETKISGSATYTYSAISGSTAAKSNDGAGKEVQIDISSSSTLENGVGFSAGFSLEQDGTETYPSGDEGNFMKFTSGDTSFMYNMDKAANLSASAVPRASTSIHTMMQGVGTFAFDYSPGAQAQQSSWNIEVAQKIGGGTAYLVYVPTIGDAGGKNDNLDGTADGTQLDLIYKGNLGVDGLNVLLGYTKADAKDATLAENKATVVGAAYNFGQVAIGVQKISQDQGDSTDDSSMEYGVTYALNDKTTVGLLYAKTDNNGTADEEITAVQVGYNLGALTVEAYGIQVENLNGSSSAVDQDKFGLRLGTKF